MPQGDAIASPNLALSMPVLYGRGTLKVCQQKIVRALDYPCTTGPCSCRQKINVQKNLGNRLYFLSLFLQVPRIRRARGLPAAAAVDGPDRAAAAHHGAQRLHPLRPVRPHARRRRRSHRAHLGRRALPRAPPGRRRRRKRSNSDWSRQGPHLGLIGQKIE